MMKLIPTDKLLHFCVSALLVLGFAALGLSTALSILAALTVGATKELLWDKLLKKGDPSWGDFAADCVGVLAGMILLTMLK